MTPEEIEEEINKKIDKDEAIFISAIALLEIRITRLLSIIDFNKNGNIVGLSKSTPQFRRLSKEIDKEFARTYSPAVLKTANKKAVDKVVKETLKISYTQSAKATLSDNIVANLAQQSALAEATKVRLKKELNQKILAKDQHDSLAGIVKNVLTGSGLESAKGRPMELYSKQLSQDSTMDYYSVANIINADEAGVEKYRYFGSLIKDSRSFCRHLKDKVLTEEEIKELDGDNWVGKKSGSTLINRGGYNCRHLWIPILP